MNSIAMRAALKGGLNQSISHSLSHNFAITIESQTSPEAIDELTVNILRTYVQSVRKYGLKGHSDMIINAINYIRRHLTEKVSLKEVADELHLSPEHLSRKFKEEMAMNITDYIHKVKIEESCSLLTSKLYSVSDIAYIFGYSSPAHYTKTFKKFLANHPSSGKWMLQLRTDLISTFTTVVAIDLFDNPLSCPCTNQPKNKTQSSYSQDPAIGYSSKNTTD